MGLSVPRHQAIADLGRPGSRSVFGSQTHQCSSARTCSAKTGRAIHRATRASSSPAAIAQQGFASAEPYLYEHDENTGWQRPVAFQTIHDAGFQVYSQTLAVRPDRLEELRPCLERIVPLIQQSAVDFLADPSATNALIVEVVAAYDTFWIYPAEVAAFSVEAQSLLGLTGNGTDDTLGNFDLDRVDTVILDRDAGPGRPRRADRRRSRHNGSSTLRSASAKRFGTGWIRGRIAA